MGLRGPQPKVWDKRIVSAVREDFIEGMTFEDIRAKWDISKFHIRKMVRPVLLSMLAQHEKEIGNQ